MNTNFPKVERIYKQFYGPSFGIVNLFARGNQTKYYPEELLKDLGISHLNAKEIKSYFLSTGMDLDGDVIHGWYINLKHNEFTKSMIELSWVR